MTKTTLLSSSSNKCAVFDTRRRRSKENYQKHDGDSNNEQIHAYEQTNQSHRRTFEEKLMGDTKGDDQIGDSVERNISQMIEALRSKISAMGNAAKTRLRLCQEDLNNNSRESSDQAPKITEDYEESPKLKGTRDQEVGSSMHRDNLVFSEVVHINTAHLVIRTKATTDAAKKLEVELDDPYLSSKQRFIENTNSKSGKKKIEISKKNVQKRFEARKIRRNKSEKDLQTNMEKFLTRSVMDADLQFRAPIGCTSSMQKFSCRSNTLKHDHRGISETCNTTPTDLSISIQSRSEQENIPPNNEDGLLTKVADLAVAMGTLDAGVGVGEEGVLLDQKVNWPISIKLPPGDPRSGRSGNADGAMDPALLLRYAVEKIHLPSGEIMFYWLGRQLRIQQYFLYLFWLVKVKLFERRTDCDNESYLIRELSVEHVHIMELLGSYGRGAQYEKDFAYQYLPYVLANAVYYGFYYLCPGSRNIYTRAFKKTVLLQVVKIMHGVQLCNATVKVLWSRLFPEDTVEVEDAAEEACEVFPVHVAVAVNNEGKYRAESAVLKTFHPCIDKRLHEGNRTASLVQTEQSSKYDAPADIAAAAPSSTEHSSSLLNSELQNLIRKPTTQVKDRFFLPDLSLLPLPLGSAQLQCEEGVAPGQRQSLEAEHTLSRLDGRHMALDDSLSVTRCSMTPCGASESVVTLNLLNPDKFSTIFPDPHVSQKLSCCPDYTHDGSCDRRIGTPLSRTQLRAQTLPYGHKLRALSRRQATETIDMKSVSPLIQEYFSSSIKVPLKMDFRGGQLTQRTVPVSWYATGGVDAHRKGSLHNDLHQNLSDSRKEVEMDFRNASLLGRNSRMDKLRRATDTCHSLLQSDAATISVFSSALVTQQQCRRKTARATATASTGDPVQTLTPKGTTDSDLMSHKDALQSASFDPFELDCFIAGI